VSRETCLYGETHISCTDQKKRTFFSPLSPFVSCWVLSQKLSGWRDRRCHGSVGECACVFISRLRERNDLSKIAHHVTAAAAHSPPSRWDIPLTLSSESLLRVSFCFGNMFVVLCCPF
jgi:hypothetical protein